MTVLEKRLKRAHEYRQNAFKQELMNQVIPVWNQVEGQYVPVRSDGKMQGAVKFDAGHAHLPASGDRYWYRELWKHITARHVLFVLAFSLILVIILSSLL